MNISLQLLIACPSHVSKMWFFTNPTIKCKKSSNVRIPPKMRRGLDRIHHVLEHDMKIGVAKVTIHLHLRLVMVLSGLVVLLSPYFLQHCSLLSTYTGMSSYNLIPIHKTFLKSVCLDFTNHLLVGDEVPKRQNEYMIDDEDWASYQKKE